jgi:hypothetical protein
LFNNSGPIYADFVGGTAEYRKTYVYSFNLTILILIARQGKYSKKSPIARAVSVTGKTFEETHVVDATGGSLVLIVPYNGSIFRTWSGRFYARVFGI